MFYNGEITEMFIFLLIFLSFYNFSDRYWKTMKFNHYSVYVVIVNTDGILLGTTLFGSLLLFPVRNICKTFWVSFPQKYAHSVNFTTFWYQIWQYLDSTGFNNTLLHTMS